MAWPTLRTPQDRHKIRRCKPRYCTREVLSMHATLEDLLSHGPVVIDGAWGTQLQSRGLPVGACPDAWNLSHPNAVEAVALAYVGAGSQIILTNTFGANRLILARHDLAGSVTEINRTGVEISR